jgi:hypothetical protein
MKTTSIILSLTILFTTVFSSPLSTYEQYANVANSETNSFGKRDLTTIWSVLKLITEDLTKMNKTIEVFDGSPLLAVPILDAAAATLKDLKAGITQVNSTEELNLITAAAVLYPVYYLYYAVDGVTSQLVSKKALFEQADVVFVVADELASFKSVAGDLITITLAKIPSYLGIISSPIGYSIKSLLENAAKAYGV